MTGCLGVEVLSGRESDNQLEEIIRKLDSVLKRLETLEKIILGEPDYADLASSLKILRFGVRAYGEPLKIISRLKLAERYLKHSRIRRDEISRYIIQALALKGPLNISAITREVRAMRGKASRRIIRSRLQILRDEGVVRLTEGFGKRYELIE